MSDGLRPAMRRAGMAAMAERTRPLKAITVLVLLVMVLAPASVAATLQGTLAWYHGLGLFYGALGGAEFAYLIGLLILVRSASSPSFRILP